MHLERGNTTHKAAPKRREGVPCSLEGRYKCSTRWSLSWLDPSLSRAYMEGNSSPPAAEMQGASVEEVELQHTLDKKR